MPNEHKKADVEFFGSFSHAVGGSDGEESACSAGDLSLTPGLGGSPGGGHGKPLQYSCLEDPHGQRSLEGYSPRDHKESDTTEGLSTAQAPEKLNNLSKAIIVIKTPKRF